MVAQNARRLTAAVARRRTLLLLVVPCLSLLVNTGIALKNGIPEPRVQDEFSYLLAADTFAHGRVTNPTPACWEHFETPHELLRPTYMSKYPPGQGLTLALGQILTGTPILGVWLISALACAAIYWMLLGFVSPDWAMLGAFVAILHPELLHWSQVYWGGSLAVLGGVIVVGAWVRLISHSAVIPILLLGIGLVILANSRPYEGLLFVIPLLLGLLLRQGKNAFRIVALLSVILLPAAAAMGYYNLRVTGHFFRMPFEEYSDQYDVFPKFFFFAKRAVPAYRNELMRLIHTVYEQGDYNRLRTLSGFATISAQKTWRLIADCADPTVLLLPLAFASVTLGEKKLRWVCAAVGIMLMGTWAETISLPHYNAPATGVVILLIIIGWQRLSGWNRHGKLIAQAAAVGYFAAAVLGAIAPVPADSLRLGKSALIEQYAQLQTGPQLIFVQYIPGHLIHDEWVYNQADIAEQRVIWARWMGRSADAAVLQHYPGRSVWLLTVGKDDLTIKPYSP